MSNTILSEKFGLYKLSVGQEEVTEEWFWDIDYLDDDGNCFGHESDNQSYASPLAALTLGLSRLGELFLKDAEILWCEAETTKAGNGTRTHDILLGKNPIIVNPSKQGVQE